MRARQSRITYLFGRVVPVPRSGSQYETVTLRLPGPAYLEFKAHESLLSPISTPTILVARRVLSPDTKIA